MKIPVIEELSEFTGLSEEEVWTRVDGMAARTAALFRQSTLPDQWYTENDAYLFELANYDEDPFRDALAQMIANYQPPSKTRVLDYGCGIGTFALMLAHRGVIVTACDINIPNTKFLRFRAQKRGLTDHVEILTPEDALNRTRYYHIVSCMHVLEHVENPPSLLDLLKRCLVSGGIFFGVAPFDLTGELFPEHRIEWAHLRLETLCEQAGFREIQTTPFGKFNDDYEFTLVAAVNP